MELLARAAPIAPITGIVKPDIKNCTDTAHNVEAKNMRVHPTDFNTLLNTVPIDVSVMPRTIIIEGYIDSIYPSPKIPVIIAGEEANAAKPKGR